MVVIFISSDEMWKVEQILERLHYHRNWSSRIYSLNSVLQTRLAAERCMEFLSTLHMSSNGSGGSGDPDVSHSVWDISLFVPDLPDIPLADPDDLPSVSRD